MDVLTRFFILCLSLCTSVHLCATVVRSPPPNLSEDVLARFGCGYAALKGCERIQRRPMTHMSHFGFRTEHG
jgi:hypothetical protein